MFIERYISSSSWAKPVFFFIGRAGATARVELDSDEVDDALDFCNEN
jgi:hypothetical protein